MERSCSCGYDETMILERNSYDGRLSESAMAMQHVLDSFCVI